MKGGGHGILDSEGLCELLEDFRGEKRVAVGNQLVRESETFEQVGSKEVGGR